MSYFVTGATGFIGRHLVQELVDHREGEIFVLVRQGSLARLETLIRRWGADRVVPVVGDLSEPGLGVDEGWVREHRGQVDHFFHLAAIYDMTADDATNETMNVGGTRNALELADALQVGLLPPGVVGGGGRRLPRPLRRDDVRRGPAPALAVPPHEVRVGADRARGGRPCRGGSTGRRSSSGHSQTGAMDKIDGPYYFFPLIRLMRDRLPAWLPLVGVDLGDTNVVPVDYVAKAMDHIAHLPGHDGEAFHLVNPEPQPVVEMINAFCAAAGAPQFATPIDRRVARAAALGLLPRALRPLAVAQPA